MSYTQAFILGLLQGMAEFLPISSSGHLAVAKHLFGLADVPLIFDVALHLATLIAVSWVFHQSIGRLIAVAWRFVIRKPLPNDKGDQKLIQIILLATLVTGIIGLRLKDLTLSVSWVYIGFLYTSLLLWLGYFSQRFSGKPYGTAQTGLMLGLFQGLAVLPGISRSGSTITAALFTKMNREQAGELAFILSIPTILAAFLFLLLDFEPAMLDNVSVIAFIIAFITSFVSGIVSLLFLKKVVKAGKLHYFSFYLVPLAIIGLLFLS
jgi:undecaprenyl-diphosphatase